MFQIQNEDWYCYNLLVLATEGGTVVFAENTISDNLTPGKLDYPITLTNVTGNVVYIEHSDGTTAMYAHMIPNSVLVKSGSKSDCRSGIITAMLSKIKPAVVRSQDFTGNKTSKNDAFVEYVAKNNVLNTIATVKARSSILKEMSDQGKIKIIGAYYDIKTGEVIFR